MKYTLLFCLAFACNLNIALCQDLAIVANIPFDNMNAIDISGAGTIVAVNGNPEYGCGVRGDAILLDGDDFLIINGRANNVFTNSDFTIGFYFKPTNFSNVQDIIAKRQACTVQRAFAVRYVPSSNSLEIILSENTTKQTNFLIPLAPGRCWTHVAITKSNKKTRVYINGELAAEDDVIARMDIENPESLAIANGPCRNVTDQRFEGYLDEMVVYDRPLNREEIRELYFEPDAIGNIDTLLFLGGTVPLRIDNTCAADVSWNPITDIDTPNARSATFTPSQEGTFKIYASFDDGTCIAADTFKIVVIDPNNLDCGKIFLPNAFTPNGDGINDLFGVDNPFAIEKVNQLEIIDRLGNTLFATSDVFTKWDGMYKGSIINPGVFIYRITFECKGASLSKTGSFTVLK